MADSMWKFLEHQKSNPEALKNAVYTLIRFTKVEVGDIVDIAVVSQDNTSQGMVTAVNVPLAEIEPFKDRAKTIIGKAAPKAEPADLEQKTLLDV